MQRSVRAMATGRHPVTEFLPTSWRCSSPDGSRRPRRTGHPVAAPAAGPPSSYRRRIHPSPPQSGVASLNPLGRLLFHEAEHVSGDAPHLDLVGALGDAVTTVVP